MDRLPHHLSLTSLRWLATALVSFAHVLPGADISPRPNILWISCEDASPWFGFSGDRFATTPVLDRFAAASIRYTQAYAPSPVCSPTRSSIITGICSTTMGTQRMRSEIPIADDIHGFPSYLRKAGYYCSNNWKTDYNTSDARRLEAESWDACGEDAHWDGRQAGQPFFAVINLHQTHQSRIFESFPTPDLRPQQPHDPAQTPLPPFYPETSIARHTMARVYDSFTALDNRVGEILAALKTDGLAEDTIIFFWSDHGQGIPRGKRTLWDTGLKVPLLVHFPDKYRQLAPIAPGNTSDRLVSLTDLGPTLLSLLHLPLPEYLQGQPFLGPATAPPRAFIVGTRDRVDEAMDVARSVRDQRYLYIRNYRPDLSWHQPEYFSDRLELRREITQLAQAGTLNPEQLTYAGPSRPAEALYDTKVDPWQLNNLADDPAYHDVLVRLRNSLHKWALDTRDLGFIPEMHAGELCVGGRPLAEAARRDADYPLSRVLTVANQVGRSRSPAPFLIALGDKDPTVRYWGTVGLRVLNRDTPRMARMWRQLLDDPCPDVQLMAAMALVSGWEDPGALDRIVGFATDPRRPIASLHGARALQLLGPKAQPVEQTMRRLRDTSSDPRVHEAMAAALRKLNGEPYPHPAAEG